MRLSFKLEWQANKSRWFSERRVGGDSVQKFCVCATLQGDFV